MFPPTRGLTYEIDDQTRRSGGPFHRRYDRANNFPTPGNQRFCLVM